MTKKTYLPNSPVSVMPEIELRTEESSSSMIDSLRLNVSPHTFMADSIAIESFDNWCRCITDNYALYDFLLLPCHVNSNHWVLVYINTKNHFLAYIDPIGCGIAPANLLKALNDLKEKYAIQFKELYVSPIILQQNVHQSEQSLVLITQTLLANGMAYNSHKLAHLLISLSPIASNVSTDTERRLLPEISTKSVLKKRSRPTPKPKVQRLPKSSLEQLEYFIEKNDCSKQIKALLADYNSTLVTLNFTSLNISLLIQNRGFTGLEALLLHGLPLINKGLSPEDLIQMLPKTDMVNLLVFLNDERHWEFLTTPDGMNLSLVDLINISQTHASHEKLQLLMIHWQLLTTVFTRRQLIEVALKKNAEKELHLLTNNWHRLVSPQGLHCSQELLINLMEHANAAVILELLLNSSLSEKPIIYEHISLDIAELLSNYQNRLAKLGFTEEMSTQFIQARGMMGLQALLKYGMPLGKQDYAPYFLINSLPKTDVVSLLIFLNDENNWALVTENSDMKLSYSQKVALAKIYGGAETLELLINQWKNLRNLLTKAHIMQISFQKKASKTLALLLGETNNESNWSILSQKFKFTREQIVSMASIHNAKTRLKLILENHEKILALGSLKSTRSLLISFCKQSNSVEILQSKSPTIAMNADDEPQRQELMAFLYSIGSAPKQVLASSSNGFFRAVSPPTPLCHEEAVVDGFKCHL